MKYQLVLQWPASSMDYDDMVELEEWLLDQLPGDSEVDGHDVGSGEVNLFIITDSPEHAFRSIRSALAAEGCRDPARFTPYSRLRSSSRVPLRHPARPRPNSTILIVMFHPANSPNGIAP